jgi:uroporphyrinogen-III synthase
MCSTNCEHELNKVWVTRSEPGAGELARQLQEQHITVLRAPLLEIAPLAEPRVLVDEKRVADTSESLATLPGLIVVLSAHAARLFVAAYLRPELRERLFVAVGKQTAAVLEQAGLRVIVPELASSEGLMGLPVIQALRPGACVWLVSGVGGRETLVHYLRRQCGAQVVKLELYERKSVGDVADLKPDQVCAVEVASVQGLQAFYTHWTQLAGNMGVAVIVPSQRIAAAAQELGFTQVYTAQDASAGAVLTQLQQLFRGGKN